MTTGDRTRRLPVAALAAVLLLAAPQAARAAEVHVEGPPGSRTIVFTGAGGEANSVLVDRDPGFTSDRYQLEDQDNPVTAGSGCANKPRQPFSGTEESIVQCETDGVTAIRIELGDGVDGVRFGDLNGNVIADTVDAGVGNDTITASNGPSVVTGGDGDDRIDTRAGDDRIGGGAGDDGIVTGQGSDTAAGEAGRDTVRGYADVGTLEIGRVTKFRGGEVNRLDGGAGRDLVEGDNGPDQISGGGGGDRLHGGGGADVLRGGGGNDRLEEGDTAGTPTGEDFGPPIAADVLHGGGGRDAATYCTRRGSAPLRLSLDRRANDGGRGEGDNIGPRGDVESILGGGESSDLIIGNGKANVLTGDCLTTVGASGNNRIFGRGGKDRLVGGSGRDLLNGGGGADRFIGNEDRDHIVARDGRRDRSINCDGVGAESGRDRATVDRGDPAATDCERVRG